MALLTNINGKFSVSDAGAVTFNNAFTFPTADGTANYVLKTNGSGQLAWAADNYENYDYWTLQGDSAANVNINSTDTLKFVGGTYIDTSATWAGGSNPRKLTINHETTSRTDTTSTDAPAFGGTFEAVTSVTTNTTGHVTAIDVSTITIPTDPGGTVKGTGTATRVAFWSASDTITSDADLYWDNTNKRLGIGTTSPQSLLSLGNAIDAQKLLLYDANDNSKYGFGIQSNELRQFFPNSATSRMVFGTISDSDGSTFSEKMRIDSSGNVGIGYTSPSSFNQRVNAPHLVVGSGSNSAGVTIFSGTTSQGSINFADGTTTTDQYTGGILYVHGSDNYMSFHTNGGTERMRIDSSGNSLFYGPAYIMGGQKLYLNNSVNTASGSIVCPGGGSLSLQSYGNDMIYLNENAEIKFSTSTVERMRITSAGGISFGSSGTAYGTSGQILKSNANASPTWVDASTVIGGPYLPLTGGTLTGGLVGTTGNFSGAVNALYFRTAAANSEYSLLTRDSTGNALFVQNAQSGTDQNIAIFQYGSAAVNQGTTVLQVAKDKSYFANCNVGIGTTSPGSKLELGPNGSLGANITNKNVILNVDGGYGTTGTPASGQYKVIGFTGTTKDVSDITGQTGGEVQKNFYLGIIGGDYFNVNRFSFWQGGDERLTIQGYGTNAGNVGIGTGSPGSKLTVSGPSNAASNTPSQAIVDIVGSSTAHLLMGTASASPYGAWINTDATGQPLILQGPGGNVGIGTTLPSAKLHVHATSGDGFVRISGDNIINSGGSIKGFNNGLAFNVAPSGGGSEIEAIRIQGNGNVGIGTTSPGYKLEIAGSTYSSGSIRSGDWYQGTSATNTLYSSTALGTFLQSPGTAGAAGTIYFRNSVGTVGANIFSGTITAAGDIVAYGSPSDIRLKENIKPIESALDKVSKLQGVTFDWKESDSILKIKEDIGFIAQDVQKVIPELVRENEDGMLSMRHQGIAPILLEAIKELKAEIEELKLKSCNCNK